MEPMLTTEDVAEFFRVDVVTVRRMISKGELTAYRVGGEYRVARVDIEDYLNRTRLPARHEPHGHLEGLAGRARKLIPSGPAGPPNPPVARAFERFTDGASSALARAQDEAHRLGQPNIGTEHILMGLLGDNSSIAARALSVLGVEPARVRDDVESVVGRGDDQKNREIGLTPRAKKVLALALAESKKLAHDDVGTEHLLLGVLSEGEGVAAQVLHNLGVELGTARRAVQEVLAEQDDP